MRHHALTDGFEQHFFSKSQQRHDDELDDSEMSQDGSAELSVLRTSDVESNKLKARPRTIRNKTAAALVAYEVYCAGLLQVEHVFGLA